MNAKRSILAALVFASIATGLCAMLQDEMSQEEKVEFVCKELLDKIEDDLGVEQHRFNHTKKAKFANVFVLNGIVVV